MSDNDAIELSDLGGSTKHETEKPSKNGDKGFFARNKLRLALLGITLVGIALSLWLLPSAIGLTPLQVRLSLAGGILAIAGFIFTMFSHLHRGDTLGDRNKSSEWIAWGAFASLVGMIMILVSLYYGKSPHKVNKATQVSYTIWAALLVIIWFTSISGMNAFVGCRVVVSTITSIFTTVTSGTMLLHLYGHRLFTD